MGMCSNKIDPNLGIAALYSAASQERLGNRELDLSERKYASDLAMQGEFMDLIKEQAPTQERLMLAQADAAEQALSRQRDVQYPLEDSIIAEANDYDSEERISREAGKADAAVFDAYGRAQSANAREQLRMGINPNSAKAIALRENGAIGLAGQAANASSTAAEQTKAKGFAMRMDAAALGRNLATNSTANVDASLRAGQAQAGNYQAAMQSANQSFASTMQGFGAAGQAFSNSGAQYSAIASNQQAAKAASSASNASIVGAGIGALGSYAAASAGAGAAAAGGAAGGAAAGGAAAGAAGGASSGGAISAIVGAFSW